MLSVSLLMFLSDIGLRFLIRRHVSNHDESRVNHEQRHWSLRLLPSGMKRGPRTGAAEEADGAVGKEVYSLVTKDTPNDHQGFNHRPTNPGKWHT